MQNPHNQLASDHQTAMAPAWPRIRDIADAMQGVTKYVFEKTDAVAEAVLYRYPSYAERTVICCSTQSGCPVGCRFCGAGDHFVRSLTQDEIIAQVRHCLAQTDCQPEAMKRLQIMFMSMGEPLLNLKELLPALHELAELYPKAALLISTSAPDIGDAGWNQLFAAALAIPTVGLQFSVHESSDEARDRLIPFKAKLDLAQIAEKGAQFASLTGRKAFFNYCAHDGNASWTDADRLKSLFNAAQFCATVSVVCERSQGLPASNQHQRDLASAFGSKLMQLGFDVRIFDPAGQDTIGGGCGQLHYVQDWFAKHPTQVKASIGAGKPVIHVPCEMPDSGGQPDEWQGQ